MRLIQSLPFGVHHCSALPQKTSDEWFIETDGVPTHEGPFRVSATAVREMARMGGLPTQPEFDALKAELEDTQLRLTQALAEVESLREFERSAVYSLEHIGQKVRKKPGPRKKEEVTA